MTKTAKDTFVTTMRIAFPDTHITAPLGALVTCTDDTRILVVLSPEELYKRYTDSINRWREANPDVRINWKR